MGNPSVYFTLDKSRIDFFEDEDKEFEQQMNESIRQREILLEEEAK